MSSLNEPEAMFINDGTYKPEPYQETEFDRNCDVPFVDDGHPVRPNEREEAVDWALRISNFGSTTAQTNVDQISAEEQIRRINAARTKSFLIAATIVLVGVVIVLVWSF